MGAHVLPRQLRIDTEAPIGPRLPVSPDVASHSVRGLVVEIGLVDPGRSTPAIGRVSGSPERLLPTTVHLPASPGAAPLIVLAHGFNGHPRKFTGLASCWADAGYVVAVPRFPVSSDEFGEPDPELFSERLADVTQQALDVSFVIDELLGGNDDRQSVLFGRIDLQHIGLFGLSLGSLAVWLATHGDAAEETRVDALIQSDGGYPGDFGLLTSVPFPVLVAHSDIDPVFDVQLTRTQFDTLPTPKFLLVLHGAVHAAVGEDHPTTADEAYRIATTVFWHRYLGGRLDEPFPDSIVIDGVTSFVDGSSFRPVGARPSSPTDRRRGSGALNYPRRP